MVFTVSTLFKFEDANFNRSEKLFPKMPLNSKKVPGSRVHLWPNLLFSEGSPIVWRTNSCSSNILPHSASFVCSILCYFSDLHRFHTAFVLINSLQKSLSNYGTKENVLQINRKDILFFSPYFRLVSRAIIILTKNRIAKFQISSKKSLMMNFLVTLFGVKRLPIWKQK